MSAGHRAAAAWLGPLCLLGLFAGASLLLAIFLWPLALRPFWSVWRAGLPAALLIALLPAVERVLRPATGRFVHGPASIGGAFVVGLFVALLIAVLHVVLIRFDPFLSLGQYLREQLWLLWLLALPQAFVAAMLLTLWERLPAERA